MHWQRDPMEPERPYPSTNALGIKTKLGRDMHGDSAAAAELLLAPQRFPQPPGLNTFDSLWMPGDRHIPNPGVSQNVGINYRQRILIWSNWRLTVTGDQKDLLYSYPS